MTHRRELAPPPGPRCYACWASIGDPPGTVESKSIYVCELCYQVSICLVAPTVEPLGVVMARAASLGVRSQAAADPPIPVALVARALTHRSELIWRQAERWRAPRF